MNITLRDYQTEIISDVRRSFSEGHKRIILQMEVGAGKTIVAAEIIRMAIEKRNRVLFIAPRRQLIYQTVEALEKFNIQCGTIMAGVQRFYQPLIQVASFDTITARVGSGRMEIPEASLVIADECHMLMSPARLNILDKYPRVLGLTATPALANGKGMGKFYTDIVDGLTMGEMVKAGHLVSMRYFVGESPDLAGAKLNKDGDYSEKFLESVNDKPKLIGAIYDNWKRIAANRTTLIFAVNRKHARHLHDEFISHGVTCEYIDGETKPEERELIKSNVMSGKTQVIVNIGVMVAGVSWDKIDCIVMARQTKNISTWRQCLGRGSRLFEGKSECIVIYHGDNFEELGRMDDSITWSLDDKTTVKERKQKEQQDSKEPKEITCKECGTVFKSRRDCPACNFEAIPTGEDIPYHEAELVEVKTTSIDKKLFYSMLLGYCKNNNKKTSYALAIFKGKFDEWPHGKKSAKPIPPSQEVLNYITSRNIAYAKRR